MPLWRCPHCGTPQPESSRCWVCRRSTTSCATCRHFRRGVASGFGLCGLDPRRTALRGTEMLECWAAPDPVDDAEPARPAGRPGDTADAPAHRTFVPVETPGRRRRPAASRTTATQEPDEGHAGPAAVPAAGRWSLWGDVEG